MRVTCATSGRYRARVAKVRLGLVLHPTADVRPTVGVVARWARTHDVELLVRRADADRLSTAAEGSPVTTTPVDETTFVDRCDALLSLGGDGTMLGALRLGTGRDLPVLGVNLGRVGMLVEVGVAELPAALDRITAGDFAVEVHPALHVTAPGVDAHAFNDLALVRTPGQGFVEATLTVDGRSSGLYRCDAVVVSTANGSTAYSYAAGGPVVSPAVRAMVVTPSAPASGISRSVVVAPSERLELTLRPGTRDIAVEVDGLVATHLGAGAVVSVVEVPEAGRVIRLDAAEYGRRRQVKLSLLDLPLLPEELRALRAGVPDH